MKPGRGEAANAELVDVMNGLLAQTRARYPDTPGEGSWWMPAHLGGSAPTPQRAAELDEEEKLERARRRAIQS